MNDIDLAPDEYNNEYENTTQALSKNNITSTSIAKKYKCLFPRVYAAPQKPGGPQMVGYKDLPIYSEIDDRTDGLRLDNPYCIKEPKGVHEILMPIVSSFRKEVQSMIKSSITVTKETLRGISEDLTKMKYQMKSHFRNEKCTIYRQSVVALGTFAGFKFGSPKRSLLYRKVFWAGVGCLTTGALCFPKETDENLRNVSFYAANTGIKFFNWWFEKNIKITPDSCECIIQPCECIGNKEFLCDKVLKEKRDAKKSLTVVNKVQPGPDKKREPSKKDKTKVPDTKKECEDIETKEDSVKLDSEKKPQEECVTMDMFKKKEKKTEKVVEVQKKEDVKVEKKEEINVVEEEPKETCLGLPFKYKDKQNKGGEKSENGETKTPEACLPYKYRQNIQDNVKTSSAT